MESKNIMIVGVGGQGTLLASKLLGRILLENGGYCVYEAATGLEAVTLVRQHPEIDLILMDIMMPNLNGWDTARRIRSMKRSDAERVPVIAMSANAFAEDVVMAKNAGMKEHIAKPWEMNRLCEIMQRYL